MVEFVIEPQLRKDRLGESPWIVRTAIWLSVPCSFPRWSVIAGSFVYGLLFIATLLSLFD